MMPWLDHQGGWNCNVSRNTLLRDFEQRVKKSDQHRSSREASLIARRRESATVQASQPSELSKE